LLGFSFGELVAAFVGGIFTLEGALALVAERGRLLGALPRGAMTSVALAEPDTWPLLPADLVVAIQRTSRSCVVSGPLPSVVAFEDRLRTQEIGYQRLDMSFAGHSASATAAAEPFARAVERVEPRCPHILIVSGVSGELLTAEQAIAPAYWGAQLHKTVRFASGVDTMIRQGCRILPEVGPGHYLTSVASQQGAAVQGVVCQPSVRSASGAPSAHLGLLRSLARLWTIGVDVDWRALYAGTAPRPVSLRHLWS
jgi:acyl transferase domain-containing protein